MQDTYKEIIIVLIAGAFVFLVFSGILVFILLFYQKKRFMHQEQISRMQYDMTQELLKAQLETQEQTYRQIGEELHDNVGQLLSSTKIMLGIMERDMQDPPDTLRTATETLGRAIQDIRSLSKALNREWLEEFNIIDNLRVEIARMNTARMVQTELETDTNWLPLTRESQIVLFRIIQEALHNSVKHACCTVVLITVRTEAEMITIRIADNGKGFNEEKIKEAGVGLINMEHRARLLGGSLRVESEPEQGTVIRVDLPVNKI